MTFLSLSFYQDQQALLCLLMVLIKDEPGGYLTNSQECASASRCPCMSNSADVRRWTLGCRGAQQNRSPLSWMRVKLTSGCNPHNTTLFVRKARQSAAEPRGVGQRHAPRGKTAITAEETQSSTSLGAMWKTQQQCTGRSRWRLSSITTPTAS